jgi:peroxiredoxin
VLIRFWLVGCPYCRATAPALNELDRRFGSRGLVVIGIHHPKSDAARDPELVKRTANEYGFHFPIATDLDWKTVHAYGVGTTFKRFTSVSFLIDRTGKIAFVHDGGEFHQGGDAEHVDCNRAYDALVQRIEQVLAS